ncbi:MAG: hypothetical protein WBD40_22065 [Tepidisphaeraceae bacterium]
MSATMEFNASEIEHGADQVFAKMRRRAQQAAREQKRRAELAAVRRYSVERSAAHDFTDLAWEHRGGTFPLAALFEHDSSPMRLEVIGKMVADAQRAGGIVIDGDSIFVADSELVVDAVYSTRPSLRS